MPFFNPTNQASQFCYDGAVLTGSVQLLLNGRCIKELNNLVVDSGLNLIAERLKDNATAVPSHIAIGTDATVPTGSQTALGAEIAREALSGVAIVAANTITFAANFAAGVGTGALIEAGLFNAGSGPDMIARTLFSGVVTKGAGDSLGIVWTFTIS